MNPYVVIYRPSVRMPDSDFAEIVTDNADVAGIRIGVRINKYIKKYIKKYLAKLAPIA